MVYYNYLKAFTRALGNISSSRESRLEKAAIFKRWRRKKGPLICDDRKIPSPTRLTNFKELETTFYDKPPRGSELGYNRGWEKIHLSVLYFFNLIGLKNEFRGRWPKFYTIAIDRLYNVISNKSLKPSSKRSIALKKMLVFFS